MLQVSRALPVALELIGSYTSLQEMLKKNYVLPCM
jgi:hypothetical protein